MLIFLLGCGANRIGTTSSSAGAFSNLSGSWLIAGSMPSTSYRTPSLFSVTVNLIVTGNEVNGVVLSQVPCSSKAKESESVTYAIPIQGSIADDGTFSLTTPSAFALTQTVTLQGSVPVSSGGPWKGVYTYTVSTLPSSCSTPTQTINATAISPLSGDYEGTALLYDEPLSGQPIGSGVSVPIKVSLQQGAFVPASGEMTAYVVLSGTISVSNSSCLTSGTTSAAPVFGSYLDSGVLQGVSVAANFLMNDGSVVQIAGQINTEDSSVLLVSVATYSMGTCGQILSGPPTGTVTLSH